VQLAAHCQREHVYRELLRTTHTDPREDIGLMTERMQELLCYTIHGYRLSMSV